MTSCSKSQPGFFRKINGKSANMVENSVQFVEGAVFDNQFSPAPLTMINGDLRPQPFGQVILQCANIGVQSALARALALRFTSQAPDQRFGLTHRQRLRDNLTGNL